MKKVTFFLVVTLLTGLSVSTFPFNLVQGSTPVNGIITQDTTWTKANSPYSLSGPVAINQGLTLTIEAGTTINLNNYYIQVNGTLIARGSNADPIHINGPAPAIGGIIFTPISNGWNEQTGSGNTIENTIIDHAPVIAQNSVKMDHNSITGSISAKAYSLIEHNNITDGTVSIGDSVVLYNNTITGSTGLGSLLFGGSVVVSVTSGSSANNKPTVSNNIINGSPAVNGKLNDGIVCSGFVSITGNTISSCKTGIRVEPYEHSSGFPLIDKNFISNNQDGIDIWSGDSTPLIQNNLLTNNTNGISVSGTTGNTSAIPLIQNNNIYDNSINMFLGVPYDINAANNWWGTTDAQAINKTIFDHKNNFNVGMVNFIPFLTTANIAAPVTPVPSPTTKPSISVLPSQNPTSTPTQSDSNNTDFFGLNWAKIVITCVVAVIGFLIIVFVLYQKKKKVKKGFSQPYV
jgi:parallel beta-helix repeat protein